MPCLVSEVVSDVITELSQVPGIATQIYAAPRIRQYVQDSVLLEIGDLWYPNYMAYFTCVPDGTTGLLTADMIGPISAIEDFSDIAYVWPANSNKPIPRLPPRVNPTLLVANNPGSTGRGVYISPDYTHSKRPFRVWPPTVTTTLTVWAQQTNKLPLIDTDKLYVDRLLLTYDAAWMYVTDDGTVPTQVDKFEKLALKRRQQVQSNMNNQPIPLDARVMNDQTDMWWEA